jgi:hypothetical protein
MDKDLTKPDNLFDNLDESVQIYLIAVLMETQDSTSDTLVQHLPDGYDVPAMAHRAILLDSTLIRTVFGVDTDKLTQAQQFSLNMARSIIKVLCRGSRNYATI